MYKLQQQMEEITKKTKIQLIYSSIEGPKQIDQTKKQQKNRASSVIQMAKGGTMSPSL